MREALGLLAGSARALLSDRLQLPAAFPDAGQRLPQLLVGDVQIALRRLDVGVPEHQPDDADVDAIAQQPVPTEKFRGAPG
jgi:hypothetical protein